MFVLNCALTNKYRLLEDAILMAKYNKFSAESIAKHELVFESYKETLDMLGYKYDAQRKVVVKV